MGQAITIAPKAITAAIGQLAGPLDQLRKKLSDISDAAAKSANSLATLGEDQSGSTKLKESLKSVNRSLSKITEKAKGVASSFARVKKAAQASFGVVQGLGEVLGGLAAPGAEIGKTAASVGISVETLQELRFAASQAGVDSEALDKGLSSLNKLVRSKDSAKTQPLVGAGVDLSSPGGAPDVLMQLADLFKSIEDPAERARTSIALLGNTDLLPLLSQGSGKIQADRTQANQVGAVMSADQVAEAQRLNRTLTELSAAAADFANVIRTNLIPVVLPLLEKLAGWVRANRELIAQKIGGFVTTIASAIESVVGVMGGWESTVLILAGVLGAKLVASLISLGLEVGKLARIFLANPIALVIAAIALGALLIIRNWESISAWFETSVLGPLTSAFDGFLKFMSGLFIGDMGAVVEGFIGIWRGVREAFGGILDGVEQVGQAFLDWMRDTFGVDLEAAATLIKTPWRALRSELAEIFDGIEELGGGLAASFKLIVETLESGAETAKQAWAQVSDFFGGLWADIKEIFEQGWAWVEPIVAKIGQATEFLANPLQATQSIVDAGAEKIDSFFRETLGLGGDDGTSIEATDPRPAFIGRLPSLAEAVEGRQGAQGPNGWVRQIVEFRNTPPGTRIQSEASPNMNLESDVGYSLPDAGLR